MVRLGKRQRSREQGGAMGNRGRGQRVRAHLSARGGSAVVLQVERAGGGGGAEPGGEMLPLCLF
jgi:hypothetical protein